MRPSVVGLITRKETRDLLRDRRTVTVIFLAPLFLYPLFGLTLFVFATELAGKPPVIGVINADAAALPGDELRGVAGGTATPFPPLFDPTGDRFHPDLAADPDDKDGREKSRKPLPPPKVVRLPADTDLDDAGVKASLRAQQVRVVLVVPPTFGADVEAGRRPTLTLQEVDADERTAVAMRAVTDVLTRWKKKAKEVRFQRDGKPAGYDELVVLKRPEKAVTKELGDSFARVFPLLLVMWLMAGSIQPAVDLTAGEKERGTMETLLISPAERGEIVLGKFLAVTFFGFSSVVWNVLCLTAAAVVGERMWGEPIVNLPGMLGCVVLGVPIAMLFSAVSLALGVFARSTKEGQYYLVPLMLLVMPLAFWSFIPTTELTPGTAVIPVTGGMLLQQKMLAVDGEPIQWWQFPLVLGALVVYVGLALTAASWQFTREAVLFRETGSAKTGGGLFGRGKKA